MQFVVVDGDWPTALCHVPFSQLWRHSTADGPRRVAGAALLRLCQESLEAAPGARGRAPPQLSAFGLAVLRHPTEDPLGPFRLFTPNSVAHQNFDMDELTAPSGFVVFAARWDALEFAETLCGVKRLRVEKDRNAASRHGEPHDGTNSEGGPVQPSSVSSVNSTGRPAKFAYTLQRGRTSALQRFTPMETYFTSVGVVTLADVNAVNRLLLSGGIRLHPRVDALLCSVCGRFPMRTLTASCCGAVACPGCAPLRATICRICGEEPFNDPESHPARDAVVLQAVRELRILYNPQLSSTASSMAVGTESSLLSPPTFAGGGGGGGGGGGPKGSVLGSIA